jgi:Core-2/I-Branching enzyme
MLDSTLPDKIAFLFMVDADPQFPRIWDRYFSGNEDKICVYICARRPNSTSWRRESLILSKPGATSAYMALFRAAYKSPRNTKFITVAESCIPMRPFNALYEYLQESSDSLVMRLTAVYSDFDVPPNSPASLEASPGISEVADAVGDYNIIKHHSQMALSRAHVCKLLSTGTVDIFSKMWRGDEYFLSAISPMRNVRQFSITYDDRRYIEGRMETIKDDIAALSISLQSRKGGVLAGSIMNTRDEIANNLASLRCEYTALSNIPRDDTSAYDKSASDLRGTESFFYQRFDEHANIDAYICEFLRNKSS